ncbi:MAG: hypothetical protein JNK82_40165 [Myxococcaceae bacterium]|nr:hypothetical protein [Myxococcaceae bacterium]
MFFGSVAFVLLSQARYLFELDGVPVGTVELSLQGDQYRYTSQHVYRRKRSEQSDEFKLVKGRPVPEGYWLWHKPESGCVDGIAELTNATGKLCADEVGAREVKGTTLGKAFTARYDATGELEALELGKSRFTRSTKPLEAGQPYEKGFAIEGKGKRLELEPPVEGARGLGAMPRGTRKTPLAEADVCLDVASAYVAEHPGARLALGLVVEKNRAYPHAWVVTEGRDVDPSAKQAKKSVPNTAYLELPKEQAGALYVELLEGKRKLVWK